MLDPKSPKRVVTAPVSHQKQPEQTKTNTIETKRKPAKSTKLLDIPPLITVWFLVRVQAGPPAFARFASFGSANPCHKFQAKRAKAVAPKPSWAKASCGLQAAAWQATLPGHQASAAGTPNQNIENNPMQSRPWAAGMAAHPCENTLTCRANQRHSSIIAHFAQAARGALPTSQHSERPTMMISGRPFAFDQCKPLRSPPNLNSSRFERPFTVRQNVASRSL